MEHLDIADLKRLLHAKSITIQEFVKYSHAVMQRVDEVPAQDADVQMTGGVSTSQAHKPSARRCSSNTTILNAPILNDSFDDDQDRSMADYIELSLQLQYNSRGRN